MPDDWRQQLLLGVLASALIQASIKAHPLDSRWWFFELAATALTDSNRRTRGQPPTRRRPRSARRVGGASIWLAWSKRWTTPSSGSAGARPMCSSLARVGSPHLRWWRANRGTSSSNSTPLLTYPARSPVARPAPRDHRLFTFGQDASFGRRSTTWLAADGLEGSQLGPATLRDWRRMCLPGIRAIAMRLSRATSHPVCVCAAGDLGGKARAVVEALLDAFESRADLVALAIDPTHGLRDYEPVVLQADAAVVLGMLPDRTSGRDDERTATLPGRDGPVALADDRLAWFSQIGDLLQSEAGSTSNRTRSIGEGFYRGGTVSWFELGLGADVPRRETAEILARVKADLTERAPLRISLQHYPGAGARPSRGTSPGTYTSATPCSLPTASPITAR